MVSFTSITQSANVLLIASLFLGSTQAAPHSSKHHASVDNAHEVQLMSTIPEIITSRTKPAHVPNVNHDVESDAKKTNLEWYEKHGGSHNFSKRNTKTVAGMTMELPADAPPLEIMATTSSGDSVAATAAQVATFKKYAGIASTAYCNDVTGSKAWTCTQCKTAAPGGVVIASFNVGSDTAGFVMRSDADKTIYLAFRGSKTISNWVTVSHIYLFMN